MLVVLARHGTAIESAASGRDRDRTLRPRGHRQAEYLGAVLARKYELCVRPEADDFYAPGGYYLAARAPVEIRAGETVNNFVKRSYAAWLRATSTYGFTLDENSTAKKVFRQIRERARGEEHDSRAREITRSATNTSE